MIELSETRLFKVLDSRRDHDSRIYVGKISELVPILQEVLEYIKVLFPHYTSHGISHSMTIIMRAGELLDNRLMKKLSSAEVFIFVISAFLHDVGMVVHPDKIENIEQDNEFKEFVESKGIIPLIKENTNGGILYSTKDIVNRYLVADYYRYKHPSRASDTILLIKEFLDPLGPANSRLIRNLRKICEGHGYPMERLDDDEEFPREVDIDSQKVNVKFLAVLLRIADLLDMDYQRSNPLVMKIIHPLPVESEYHWTKAHLSDFNVSPKEIRIGKTCTNQNEHRILKDWTTWLSNEIRHARAIFASDNRIDFSPPEPIVKIESDGSYEFRDYLFKLDNEEILKRLVGERLYGNKWVFLTEQIQNSVDALRCRAFYEYYGDGTNTDNSHDKILEIPKDKRSKYHVIVTIGEDYINGEKLRYIEVEDNGLGMTRNVIENYFLKIGKSYYRSADFMSRFKFRPSSHFGIGFLSSFIVSNYIIVETCPMLETTESITMEIPNWKGYFITRKSNRTEPGTRVRTYINPATFKTIISYDRLAEELGRILRISFIRTEAGFFVGERLDGLNEDEPEESGTLSKKTILNTINHIANSISHVEFPVSFFLDGRKVSVSDDSWSWSKPGKKEILKSNPTAFLIHETGRYLTPPSRGVIVVSPVGSSIFKSGSRVFQNGFLIDSGLEKVGLEYNADRMFGKDERKNTHFEIDIRGEDALDISLDKESFTISNKPNEKNLVRKLTKEYVFCFTEALKKMHLEGNLQESRTLCCDIFDTLTRTSVLADREFNNELKKSVVLEGNVGNKYGLHKLEDLGKAYGRTVLLFPDETKDYLLLSQRNIYFRHILHFQKEILERDDPIRNMKTKDNLPVMLNLSKGPENEKFLFPFDNLELPFWWIISNYRIVNVISYPGIKKTGLIASLCEEGETTVPLFGDNSRTIFAVRLFDNYWLLNRNHTLVKTIEKYVIKMKSFSEQDKLVKAIGIQRIFQYGDIVLMQGTPPIWVFNRDGDSGVNLGDLTAALIKLSRELKKLGFHIKDEVKPITESDFLSYDRIKT